MSACRCCAPPAATRSCSTRPVPGTPLSEYTDRELRFRRLRDTDPAEAARLATLAQEAVDQRWHLYEEMATRGPERFPADARPGR